MQNFKVLFRLISSEFLLEGNIVGGF